jgi:hypothetical protein
VNQQWKMAEFAYRPHGWSQARRYVVARRFIPTEEPQATLFALGRYMYRAWGTNMNVTPAGIWHFYDGRSGMEPGIRTAEDFALRNIPTASFAANSLYLGNHPTGLQSGNRVPMQLSRGILAELGALEIAVKLFLLPGELTRPHNRLNLRLKESPMLQDLARDILKKVHRLKPIKS